MSLTPSAFESRNRGESRQCTVKPSGLSGSKPVSAAWVVRLVKGLRRISAIFRTGSNPRVGSKKRHA